MSCDSATQCEIDGQCVAGTVSKTDDTCLVCDPDRDPAGWSPSEADECASSEEGDDGSLNQTELIILLLLLSAFFVIVILVVVACCYNRKKGDDSASDDSYLYKQPKSSKKDQLHRHSMPPASDPGYVANVTRPVHALTNGGFRMPHSVDGRRMWMSHMRMGESLPSTLSENLHRQYNSLPGYGPRGPPVVTSIQIGGEYLGPEPALNQPPQLPPRPEGSGIEVRSDVPVYAADDKSMHSMPGARRNPQSMDGFSEGVAPHISGKVWEEPSYNAPPPGNYTLGQHGVSATINIKDNALIKVPLGTSSVPIEIGQVKKHPSFESITEAVNFEEQQTTADAGGLFQVEAKAYVAADDYDVTEIDFQ